MRVCPQRKCLIGTPVHTHTDTHTHTRHEHLSCAAWMTHMASLLVHRCAQKAESCGLDPRAHLSEINWSQMVQGLLLPRDLHLIWYFIRREASVTFYSLTPHILTTYTLTTYTLTHMHTLTPTLQYTERALPEILEATRPYSEISVETLIREEIRIKVSSLSLYHYFVLISVCSIRMLYQRFRSVHTCCL